MAFLFLLLFQTSFCPCSKIFNSNPSFKFLLQLLYLNFSNPISSFTIHPLYSLLFSLSFPSQASFYLSILFNLNFDLPLSSTFSSRSPFSFPLPFIVNPNFSLADRFNLASRSIVPSSQNCPMFLHLRREIWILDLIPKR